MYDGPLPLAHAQRLLRQRARVWRMSKQLMCGRLVLPKDPAGLTGKMAFILTRREGRDPFNAARIMVTRLPPSRCLCAEVSEALPNLPMGFAG